MDNTVERDRDIDRPLGCAHRGSFRLPAWGGLLAIAFFDFIVFLRAGGCRSCLRV